MVTQYSQDNLSNNTSFSPECYFFIILFIYLWLHWVFVTAHGLSLVEVGGSYSSLVHRLSFQWLLIVEHGLWGAWASVVVVHWLLHRMWDLPRPGIETVFNLHWQADSLPLSCQGSPSHGFSILLLLRNTFQFTFQYWHLFLTFSDLLFIFLFMCQFQTLLTNCLAKSFKL